MHGQAELRRAGLVSIGKVWLISFQRVGARTPLASLVRRLATPCREPPPPPAHIQFAAWELTHRHRCFVKANNKRKRDHPLEKSCDEPRTRKVIYYEPYVCGEDGERPLWLHNLELGDGKGVDSNWPSVVSMQCRREIKQLPLATFEALHHEEQPDFRCPEH